MVYQNDVTFRHTMIGFIAGVPNRIAPVRC